MKNARIWLMCGVANALYALPAAAQTATPDAPTATNTTAPASINDIVVTAQRREQRVLDVPLSIQVASGEQLQAQGIKDLTSLQFTTPGFMTQTNSGFTLIYMRGIGNDIFLSADPSVAVFVDDVPRIYGSMSDNIVDVERIEVLKGAQGGLYGRNATGGVVNVISRQPRTDAIAGTALVSYGERDTFRASAFINLPISDTVAVSLAGERATHNSYVKTIAQPNPYSAANFPTGAFLPVPNGTAPIPVSPTTNVYGYTPDQTAAFFNAPTATPKLNNQDFWFVRGKLLFQPNSDLKIVLAADYSKKNDATGGGQYNFTPAVTQSVVQAYFGLFGVNANLPAGFLPTVTRKFTSNIGTPAALPIEDYGLSGTATLSTDSFDFTSITAYRHQKTGLLADVNNTAVPTALLDVRFTKHFVYQELRAVSSFSGPFRLIFGGTYLENIQKGGQNVALLNPAFVVGDGFVSDRVRNWSIYAEAGYDLSDDFSVTASGRYIHETNRALFTRPVASTARTVQQKLVPSVTLTYKLDNGNIYARWARGFKTGGINLPTPAAYYPRPEDGSVFGPESVDTYEVGYKQGLLNGRLQLTAAVFYNDFRNLQFNAVNRPEFPQITTAIVNAKSARTYGVEGSVNWRVATPLTLGVSAGYLNAKYKDFRLTSTVLQNFDQSGQQMPKAPKLQLALTGSLDQPMNDKFRLVSNVLVSHVSQVLYQRSTTALPDAIGPAYWLVNARIGVRTIDDRYGIALVADNLFNEGYYTYGQSFSTGVNLGWGNPRIVRGEVTAKF